MKLHFMGKYNLDPESLPSNPHQPGAVKFKEEEDSKAFGRRINCIAVVLMIPLFLVLYFLYGNALFFEGFWGFVLSIPLPFIYLLPSVICFKKDVYMYTNVRQGMVFIVGPETMSKSRFIFMCLFPSLIFGFIPYTLGLIVPSLCILGVFGLFGIATGAGSYYNIFNAITQMPKNSRAYMHKFNSFWYMPK